MLSFVVTSFNPIIQWLYKATCMLAFVGDTLHKFAVSVDSSLIQKEYLYKNIENVKGK